MTNVRNNYRCVVRAARPCMSGCASWWCGMSESCPTCEWVVLHMCAWVMSHTHTHTHMSVSRFASRCIDVREEMCDGYVCAMTCSYVWHDSVICVPQLIYMRDMTYSYVWHVPFICVTWLLHMCDTTRSYACHDSSIFVWHGSFMSATWLLHICDMTHQCVWRDSFACVTWLIHTCDMSYSYARHMWYITGVQCLGICVYPVYICIYIHMYIH